MFFNKYRLRGVRIDQLAKSGFCNVINILAGKWKEMHGSHPFVFLRGWAVFGVIHWIMSIGVVAAIYFSPHRTIDGIPNSWFVVAIILMVFASISLISKAKKAARFARLLRELDEGIVNLVEKGPLGTRGIELIPSDSVFSAQAYLNYVYGLGIYKLRHSQCTEGYDSNETFLVELDLDSYTSAVACLGLKLDPSDSHYQAADKRLVWEGILKINVDDPPAPADGAVPETAVQGVKT